MDLSPSIAHGIESWKLWSFLISAFASVIIGGYKGWQWVRDIREKDLKDVKASLTTVANKIEESADKQLRSTEFQTTALVRELSELRGLFYGAFNIAPQVLAPVRSKPAAKRKPVIKKVAKKPRLAMAAARKK